jgi:DNA-binding SARP family transcriptional activator
VRVTHSLQIQLLGEFCLTYDGSRVTAVHSPRLRALLAYLIVHRGAPQPRQHLAFMLWPDSSEEQARTNLRNLVHLLRQALPHSDCCLRCEGQVLLWEPHVPYALDTVEFERAIEAGEYARAIALYSGDLLPECYGDWIMPERERLRQMYLTALDHQAQVSEEAREFDAALVLAQQLLREDPLCETHCRRVLRLQMLAGNRAAALRAYHAFATALRREVGVDPSAATQQLYSQLLQGSATPAAGATSAAGPTGPASPTGAAPALVGRQREWAALREAWESAAAGHSHLVLLTGEAGIGKSRLAEELLNWVARQNYPVAAARCYAAEGSLPYSPIVSWLRSRPLTNLAAPWRAELARILPDADGRSHGLDADWERHRLFEALVRAVLGWGQPCGAERRGGSHAGSYANTSPMPILLLLDDIQWCDHETLDWLHFLLRWDPASRLLVVGAARIEDMAVDQPLAPLIASLRRNGMVTEIELGPLDRDNTFALAAQVLGRALDPTLAEPLRRGSEGNPLFVVEMVRAAAGRTGPLDPQRHAAMLAAAAQPLPPKLRGVLTARLAQLSPSALAVAQLVAVYSRPCQYDTLARTCDLPEPQLVQALDELWRRRILREVDAESYEFTHEKLREVCCEEMSAARRRLVGRRFNAATVPG